MEKSSCIRRTFAPIGRLRRAIGIALIGFMAAPIWTHAIAETALEVASHERLLDSLLQNKVMPIQARLDSLTQRIAFNDEPGQAFTCEEIKCMRAEIVYFCMMGGQSDYLPELLEGNDACTPTCGTYLYCLASVHFYRGNFHEATTGYEQALAVLETGHYMAPNAQFNLAAALHRTGHFEEAIALLLELISPDSKWAEHVDNQSVLFQNIVHVNAAAMMVTNGQFKDAIDLLNRLDREELTPYWRNIGDCNRYMAQSGMGEFALADSIWLASIQFIPLPDLPSEMMGKAIESVLATGQTSYLRDMRSAIAKDLISARVVGPNWYDALLSPNLTEDVFESNLLLLRASNEQKRNELGIAYDYASDRGHLESLGEIEQHLEQATQSSANWKRAALGLIALGGLLFWVWWKSVRNKKQGIARAIEQVESEKSEEDTQSGVRISLHDIRSLNEAIIKGSKVGEALRVVRKLELLQREQEPDQPDLNLSSLAGIETLNSVEMTILRMAAKNIPTKEIAVQLALSVGHINNARSSIRSKLDVPSSERLGTWLYMTLMNKGAAED
jgi:DNA-binding CsgD family transcriptional regulator/tetratricopeptide (TPR) repeat protein